MHQQNATGGKFPEPIWENGGILKKKTNGIIMRIADIPTTTVTFKMIKRILPDSSLLSQHERRVLRSALREWSPRLPWQHHIILSQTHHLYISWKDTHTIIKKIQIITNEINKEKRKTSPGTGEWREGQLRQAEMENTKRKSEKLKRRRNERFDLKHDIVSMISVMALAFKETKKRREWMRKRKEAWERLLPNFCVRFRAIIIIPSLRFRKLWTFRLCMYQSYVTKIPFFF